MEQLLYIKWNDRNNTGIALIDEQHRGIVSIINTFHYMMSKRMSNHMLYSCISDTLKNYSRIHFITEEGFMAEAQYEHFEQHKDLHRGLTREIERIEIQGIKHNDAKPLLDFLKRWWLDHINDKDQLYVPYLCPGGKDPSGG
jgi:hemerythrin-like metal-binding protein